MVFIYRFHCTSATTMYPLGGLYIQVPLYISYYNVSLGWSLCTDSTVHQLLHCVPWVVFMYRFHCTSTTTLCPLGGLYIQVLLYINSYSVFLGWSYIQVPLYINYYLSLGWSLYTGSTVCTHCFIVHCVIDLHIHVHAYIYSRPTHNTLCVQM